MRVDIDSNVETCATGDASALAGAFGLMNLFARSLGGCVLNSSRVRLLSLCCCFGGISSDICFKYFGFRGRISDPFGHMLGIGVFQCRRGICGLSTRRGIWAQFLALFFEAIFLFSFGNALFLPTSR